MLKKILFTGILVSSLMSVYAATPTLTLSNTSNGDYVLVSTTGGTPNMPVVLYYYSTLTSGLQSKTIGNTDANGSFWTTVSTGAYGVSSNASVYIIVNGSQSQQVAWPYVNTNSTTGSTLTLSQTGVALSLGHTATITATNGTSMYLFNNTNPSVANISINGNQLTVTANNYGTTIFTICSGSSSNCASVYVVVQSGNAPALTFSQSNATVATGQTIPISIYGGSGVYTILNNSNTGAISTSLSGNTMNVQANSGAGQATITVCTTDMLSCGIVNVSIGTVTSSALSFSQSNPSISIGQTSTITITGSTGGYYISSNSNSGVAQASISGSTLSLYGSSYGSATIVVCSSSGSCGSVFATVAGGGGGGNISLGQSSLVLVTGQVVSIPISGGSLPYSTFNTQNGIVTASISNNLLTVTGVAAGSTSVNVCSSGGGCVVLSVVVNAGTGATSVGTSPGFSQSTATISTGQSVTISITGSGGYYISNNTNPSVATGVISGATVVITGGTTGQTALSICQSTSQCNVITVTVNGVSTNTSSNQIILSPYVPVGQYLTVSIIGQGGPYVISSPNSSYYTATLSGNTILIKGTVVGSAPITVCTTTGSSCTTFTITFGQSNSQTGSSSSGTSSTASSRYMFYNPLKYGSYGDEVVELQKRLHEEGFFNSTYSPNYGPATEAAVKAYQKAHGITQLGNIGPSTRAALNK